MIILTLVALYQAPVQTEIPLQVPAPIECPVDVVTH